MPLDLRALSALALDCSTFGASDADLLLTDTHRVSLLSRGKAMPRIERSVHTSLAVRVWLDDGRCGLCSGDAAEATELIKSAVQKAKTHSANYHAGPVDNFTPSGKALATADLRHAQITDQDRIEILTTNERAAAKVNPRIRTSGFRWQDALTHRRFANSRGIAAEEAFTDYSLAAEITLQSHDPIALQDHVESRSFATLACLPWGHALAKRAAVLDGPTTTIDGPIRVLLPPRPAARLIAWLADHFDDEILRGQETFLTADGGIQWHSRLHLLDDGSLPGALRTASFDDRGVTSHPITLIREGRVAGAYLTPERARMSGRQPTGHFVDGKNRPSNLILNAGLRTINTLLSEYGGEIFEVDDLPDLSNIDLKTGDFDVPVQGRMRRSNGMGAIVRDVRLRGNLRTALRDVPGVASDTDRIGHVDAPAIFIDGLVVYKG